MSDYEVAAYVWPAYTGNEPRTRMFWPEGIANGSRCARQPQVPGAQLGHKGHSIY